MAGGEGISVDFGQAETSLLVEVYVCSLTGWTDHPILAKYTSSDSAVKGKKPNGYPS
jgi:hypothetical protein